MLPGCSSILRGSNKGPIEATWLSLAPHSISHARRYGAAVIIVCVIRRYPTFDRAEGKSRSARGRSAWPASIKRPARASLTVHERLSNSGTSAVITIIATSEDVIRLPTVASPSALCEGGWATQMITIIRSVLVRF